MNVIRKKRIEKELLKIISSTVEFKLRDKYLNMVTITQVIISTDILYAKIYFNSPPNRNHDKIKEVLTKSSGFIKKEIAKAKILRAIPELTFIYDETEDNVKKLDEIFEKIHNEKRDEI